MFTDPFFQIKLHLNRTVLLLLPGSFEIHWVRQYLVDLMGLAGIVNTTVYKTEPIFTGLWHSKLFSFIILYIYIYTTHEQNGYQLVDSSHKGPLMQEVFPCHDLTMCDRFQCVKIWLACPCHCYGATCHNCLQLVLWKIQSRHDSAQTDRQTDGQMDNVKPVYPPFNFVEVEGIIRRLNSPRPSDAYMFQ